jgi:intermediate peptidase
LSAQVVSQVLSDPKLCASLSEEALSVAIVFQRDFEKSGIHLPPASRARFVDLSDELLVLGRKFLSAQPGGTTHALPQEWLAGVPGPVGSALASVPRRNGALQIPAGGWEAQTILKYAPDERARQTAFAALNGAPKDQVDTLEELLRRRADLADLTGSESFAELTLSDKMAKRPGEHEPARARRSVHVLLLTHALCCRERDRVPRSAQRAPLPAGPA